VAEPKEETPLDRLWKEYGQSFRDFDDLTLARWCAQTLGQLHGRSWRMSHPLVGAYRLAAQFSHDRQIWLKRLVNLPVGYVEAKCCRAPLLPLFTRDIAENGLLCQHCAETCIEFPELNEHLRRRIELWSRKYREVHEVAHWDDGQRAKCGNYDAAYETAAQHAEQFLVEAAREFVPQLLDQVPAIIWEDQDECLEVRPEDLLL
jgi:hypothetical protein